MLVKEELRAKAGLVYNVVETVILAMSVGLMLWVAKIVVDHGQVLASHSTMLNVSSGRLDVLEARGSRSLETHVREDDARVDDLKNRVTKLESAVLGLASVPNKIDNLTDGQKRIERMIEEHMNRSRP